MRRAAAVVTALGVLQRGLLFLLLPFVARAMSVEEYGIVSIMAVGLSLTSAIVGAPVEAAVTRGSADASPTSVDGAMLSAARTLLLIPIPAIGIVVAVLISLSDGTFLEVPAPLWALEIAAATTSAFALSYASPRLRALRELHRYIVLALVIIAATAVSKLVFVVLIPLGSLGWAISDLIAAMLSLLASVVLMSPLDRGLQRPAMRALMRFSGPLLPHTVSNWVIGFLNRPLLLLVVPLIEVGRYSMAFNAANAAMIIGAELQRALVVEYARDRFPAPSRPTAYAMKLQLTGAVGLAILVCAASVPFVAVILPADYAGIEPIIGVLGLIVVGWTVYAIALNFIVQTAKQSQLAWLCPAAGAFTMVGGTLTLGPSLGLMGAALATVACYVVMAFVALGITRRLRLQIDWRRGGLGPWQTLLAMTLVTLALAPTVLNWPFAVWLSLNLLAIVGVMMAGIRLLRHGPGQASEGAGAA